LAQSGARFPRQARLIEPAHYQRVFTSCRGKSSDRWLTLLASPNTLDIPRLGLAISRKAARHAVARNRIKRIVRESFRQHKNSLGALDVVVIARSGVAARNNAELRSALAQHWKRLVRLCETS
jgi:ribonuclease P protein component